MLCASGLLRLLRPALPLKGPLKVPAKLPTKKVALKAPGGRTKIPCKVPLKVPGGSLEGPTCSQPPAIGGATDARCEASSVEVFPRGRMWIGRWEAAGMVDQAAQEFKNTGGAEACQGSIYGGTRGPRGGTY